MYKRRCEQKTEHGWVCGDPDPVSHALEQGVDGLDLEDPAGDRVLHHSLKKIQEKLALVQEGKDHLCCIILCLGLGLGHQIDSSFGEIQNPAASII